MPPKCGVKLQTEANWTQNETSQSGYLCLPAVTECRHWIDLTVPLQMDCWRVAKISSGGERRVVISCTFSDVGGRSEWYFWVRKAWVVTMAAGGKLTARNSQIERVVAGKCFWISGGNLGGFMGLDMLCKFRIEAGCGVVNPILYCL